MFWLRNKKISFSIHTGKLSQIKLYRFENNLCYCSHVFKGFLMSPHGAHTFPYRSLYFFLHGSHRLEKYLNILDCLEKYLKIKSALKST